MKKYKLYYLLIICILFTSFNIPSKAASKEEWKQEPFMLSGKGVMHSVTIGKSVYLIGGAQSSVVKSVDIFNTVTKTWSQGQDMPNAVYGRAYAEYNGKIYLFGGTDSTLKYFTAVDIYNPVSDSWSVGKAMPYPVYYAHAVTINNYIYVFGGVSADNKNYIQIYNTMNNSWTTKSMPMSNRQFTLNVYDGKVYMIGGHDGTNYFDDVNIYNPETNTWSKGKDMPTIRAAATSIILGSKIYVIAGRNYMSDNKTLQSLEAVQVYDISTDSWTELTPLPLGRRGAASACVDGRIYVFGGNSPETGGYLDSVVSLKLENGSTPENEELQILLYPDEEVQLSISYELGDNKNFEWVSSNSETASVDADGKVTAVNGGTSIIEVRNKANTYTEYISVRVMKDEADPRLAVHLQAGKTVRLYLREDPLSVNWLSRDRPLRLFHRMEK